MSLIQRSFNLLNARSIFAVLIECSVFMVLVFYNKGTLEKVTLQRAHQFSNVPKSKEAI